MNFEQDIPFSLRAVLGLVQWLRTSGWAENYNEYLDDAFGETLDAYGYESFRDMCDAVGENSVFLQAAAIEDFISGSSRGSDGPLAEYLRGPGKSIGQPERAYLLAVADSVMSVYEVIEVIGDIIRAKDRLRGGSVRVRPPAADALSEGDVLVSRKLTLAGEEVLSLGSLIYPPEAAEEAISSAKAEISSATSSLKPQDFVKREAITSSILSDVGPAFMADWLNFLLASVEFTDDMDAGPQIVKVALVGGIDSVRARLAQNTRLRAEATEDSWRWLPDFPGKGPISPEEGAGVQALVRLVESEQALEAEVQSLYDGRMFVAFLQGLLDESLGEVSIEAKDTLTLLLGDDLIGELDDDDE